MRRVPDILGLTAALFGATVFVQAVVRGDWLHAGAPTEEVIGSFLCAALIGFAIDRRLVRRTERLAGLVAQAAGGSPSAQGTKGRDPLATLGSLSSVVLERVERSRRALIDSETRFEAIADAAPVLIWVSGPDKRFVYVNRRWLDFTGRPRETELGDGWTDALHPEDRGRVVSAYLDAFESRAHYLQSYRHRRSDGTYRWFLCEGAPRHAPDGTFLGYVGSCLDVTEQKTLERELTAARESAESASRVKSEFIRNMSHELRTPLNGIMGLTALALESELLPSQRENLQLVMSSCESLKGVINEVLDFSRMESGILALDHFPFSPRKRINALADLFQGEISRKGLNLTVSVEDDVPDCVRGDGHRLSQVLSNLLSNAVKFSPHGREIVMSASLVTRTEGRVTLQFTVKDHGIGISDEKRREIFAAFTQADGSPTRRYGGLGLGLTTAARLLSLMGGPLDVESREGIGSLFFFTLEFEEAESAPAAVQRDAAPPLVLVVEDNGDSREVIRTLLEKHDYRVIVAKDGVEAVNIAAKTPADLILMDYMLPDLDGIEAARLIRAQQRAAGLPPVPIVALSAHAHPEDIGRYAEAEMDGFVPKPVDIDSLLDVIGRCLKRAGSTGACASRQRTPDSIIR